MALAGLTLAFVGENTPDEIRELAKENFRRLGENYACAIKTASMNLEELRDHLEFVCGPELQPEDRTNKPRGEVVAIGHFGNFELYARFVQWCPAYDCAATYRGLAIYCGVGGVPGRWNME